MNKQKNKRVSSVLSGALATFMLLTGIAPILLGSQTVYAAELEPRYINMSDSTAGKAGVTYGVNFTTATAGVIEEVIVDFCNESGGSGGPIVGTTCTAPTGLSVANGGTVTATGVTGLNAGTWTAGDINGTTTFTLSNTSATTSVAAGTAVSFNITSMVNPTAEGTFYARVYTYAAPNTTYTATAPGSYTDDGGDALSTNATIDVTATVQETLTFCVYTGASCNATATSAAVPLGNQIGTSGIYVIDSSAVYTGAVNFTVSTNAINGGTIYLYGGTLTSGTNTIPALTTAGSITAGTADFGLYLSTLGTNVTASGGYGTATTAYYLNTAGGALAAISGPVNASVSTITYGVTASNTTVPGVYTASHQLVATPKF